LMAAVYAFHKLYQSPAGDAWTKSDHVSRRWTIRDWRRLQRFTPEVPVDRPGEDAGYRLEVEAHHEVMWLILDGEVEAIFHVSVGGEFVYKWNNEDEVAHTPRGDLDFYRYWKGKASPLGWMYKAWYYKYTHRDMALHGYFTVPPYPASHGCVRVIYDDAEWLLARIGGGSAVGPDVTPIHIWDG